MGSDLGSNETGDNASKAVGWFALPYGDEKLRDKVFRNNNNNNDNNNNKSSFKIEIV